MKGPKPFALIALGIFICAIMSGCASHAPANGPSALDITPFTLIPGVVGVSYQQVLLASGGTTPYTWTLTSGTLPPGLSLASNGTISGTPTLQSGITYPNTYNFTAKVVDSQTPVAAYNTVATSITINPALTLAAATLSPGIVGSSYSAVVTAAGGYGGPNCYTYALASGSLPDGLSLTAAGCGTNGAPLGGTISGTPTAAGTFVFTIQATDAYQETATGQFTIVISGRLQGSYVINMQGFIGGVPLYMTGSFIADGNGNITAGVLDQTGGSVPVPDLPFTGTYTLPVGTNLGSMTLSSALGNFNYTLLVSTAGDTRVITSDPNIYASGLIRKQTATALPSTATSYAFGLFGNDAAGLHYAAAGAIAATSSMMITGGEEDINDAGTVSPQVLITGGNLAATPPDPTTGRGQAKLTTASGTLNYAYYVVSSTELAGVAIDYGAPQTAISILQQGAGGTTGGGSFSNASLKGQSVIQLSGLDATLGLPDVSVGVVTFDGSGNIARTDGLPAYLTDENDGGTVSQNNITSGTYNVDPTCGAIQFCGRVTVTGIGANQPVWYLIGANHAFVVGTDPHVTSGNFVQQSGAPYTIGSILGSYLGGTGTPMADTVTNQVEVAITPPPGGLWSMRGDSNGPGGFLTGQNFSGNYDCSTPSNPPLPCSTLAAALGRYEVTQTSDPTQQVFILYIIGGSAGATGGKTGVLGVNVGSQAGGTEPNPVVSIFGH